MPLPHLVWMLILALCGSSLICGISETPGRFERGGRIFADRDAVGPPLALVPASRHPAFPSYPQFQRKCHCLRPDPQRQTGYGTVGSCEPMWGPLLEPVAQFHIGELAGHAGS